MAASNATSSILTTLLSSSAIKGISKTSNANTDDVKNILAQAVPSLLQGANKQATTASTAESFSQALSDHAQNDTSNLTSFLKNVDLTDGSKIVSHLLTKSATNSITKAAGTDAATTNSVLSAAAPLLMSLLGQQTQTSSGSTNVSAMNTLLSGLVKNVSVTDVLGGLLGSGSATTSTATTTTNANKKTSSAKKPSSSKKDDSTTSSTSAAGGLISGLMGLLK